jgi:hypothetical protein
MSVSRHLAAPVLGFIAVVQAVRFAESWPVSINGFSVPVWASAVAAVAIAALAVLVWREGASPRR